MRFIVSLLSNFKLTKEREEFGIIEENINNGVVFRGTNLWILIFAIFIASVGLNVNSTAVIIGAMLVSPLMGPIIGMGFSLATYNFTLLKKSLVNYAFAIGVSLLTSTIYFAISPLKEGHSEILARTSPTIYDVLIAVFGGLAGIVAISSRFKGNVITGVAIATALMPPLCTAGYGLATLQWKFFLGAFYLFTINTVFIALATMIFTRVIKFPATAHADARLKKVANRWVTVISILTVVPSIYLAYVLVKEDSYLQSANQFISNETNIEGNYLLKSEVDPKLEKITLIYGGKGINEKEKEVLSNSLKRYDLNGTELVFQVGFDTQDEEKTLSQIDQLNLEINRLQSDLNVAQHYQDSILADNQMGGQILTELKTLYPEIQGCSMAKSFEYFEGEKDKSQVYLINIQLKKDLEKEDDLDKIKNWLSKRLKTEKVILSVTLHKKENS